jgi:hypothetical protein
MIIGLSITAAVIMAIGTLFGFSKQGLSQISGGRVRRVIRYFVLSLSRRRFGAAVGDKFVETPQTSGSRSIVHFFIFLLCFYFGFVRRPRT